MKLLMIKTGEIVDYKGSYALRLIEQGKAIIPPAAKAEPAKPARGKKKE